MSAPDICEHFPRALREFRENEAVLGILLFGSYARGAEAAGSDVDLLLLVRDEESESVRQEGDLVLDITIASKSALEAALETNTAETLNLWRDAIVIHDPDGELDKLQELAAGYERRGAPRPDAARLTHTRHQADDLMRSIRSSRRNAPATSQYLIFHLVELLIHTHFEQCGRWTPSVKTQLYELGRSDPYRGQMMGRVLAGTSIEEKLAALGQLIDHLLPDEEQGTSASATASGRRAQSPVRRNHR